MIVAAGICAGLASLLHVYIFYLESFAWTAAKTRRTFGVSEADAQTTKGLAFNQGFYNLFLAIVTVVGILLLVLGMEGAGAALVFAGAGSMLAAALVLVLSDGSKLRAALMQGTLPLLAVVLLAIGLAAG